MIIPIHSLFESHLTVGDLERSMAFYSGILGLELARVFAERKVAFYWTGRPGDSMLGLWESGSGPNRLSLHIAFSVDLAAILEAPALLQAAGIAPLDFLGNPADEPVVLAWMPAASLYFRDPDGNLLEYISMLPDPPQPELEALPWSRWTRRSPLARCVEEHFMDVKHAAMGSAVNDPEEVAGALRRAPGWSNEARSFAALR